MSRRDRQRTEQLLARGRLSGTAREEVLARVLRDTPEARGWFSRLRFPLAFGVPALAAIALVVSFQSRDGDEDLRAKGSAELSAPFELVCTAPAGPACRRSGKLLLRVDPLPQGGFVAAYLTRAGNAERLWLSPPRADARTLAVPASTSAQLLTQGLELSALEPGTYEVHLRLAPRALTRAELDARRPEHEVRLPLTVSP